MSDQQSPYALIAQMVEELHARLKAAEARAEKVEADLARAVEERDEAQAALWRIPPNVHAVPQADPFEGPGETYHDAYKRVKEERDAALVGWRSTDWWNDNAGKVHAAAELLRSRGLLGGERG